MTQARVLVTGATGAVGPRVVQALHAANCGVRALSLDAPRPSAFPPDTQILVGDVTDRIAVRNAMHGVDAVVHLAALLHIVNPPPELRGKYERINVGGTANVVEEALAAGARRLVFFSTIAVYGASSGAVLDENSAPCPNTFYSQTKLGAEKIVLAAHRPEGEPLGVVLRLGAVYGARIKGNYERMLRALARKRFLPVGQGSNRRTLVYDKDVAQAAVLGIQHPSAAGKIYNVTDGQFHSLQVIIATMCEALGTSPPRWAVPVVPVRLAVGFLEDALGVIGQRAPIGRITIDKYTEDVAVAGKRIGEELGFVPRYDLLAGWRETVSEMRARGDL